MVIADNILRRDGTARSQEGSSVQPLTGDRAEGSSPEGTARASVFTAAGSRVLSRSTGVLRPPVRPLAVSPQRATSSGSANDGMTTETLLTVARARATAPRDISSGSDGDVQAALPATRREVARPQTTAPRVPSIDSDRNRQPAPVTTRTIVGSAVARDSEVEGAASAEEVSGLEHFGLSRAAGPVATVARPAVHSDLSVENRAQRVSSGGLWVESELPELSAEGREVLIDLLGHSSRDILVLPTAGTGCAPAAIELLEAAAGLAPMMQLFGVTDFAARCMKMVQVLPLLIRHILDQRHLRGRLPRSESALAEELELAITALRRAEASEAACSRTWLGRLNDEVAAYEDRIEAQFEQHRVGLRVATERVLRRDRKIEDLSLELERQRMCVEDLEGQLTALRHALANVQLATAAQSDQRLDVDALLQHLDACTLLRGNWIRLREILTSYHSGTSERSAPSTMVVVEALDLPRDVFIPAFVRRADGGSQAERDCLDGANDESERRPRPGNVIRDRPGDRRVTGDTPAVDLPVNAPAPLFPTHATEPPLERSLAPGTGQAGSPLSSGDVSERDDQAAAESLTQLRSPTDVETDQPVEPAGYDFGSGDGDGVSEDGFSAAQLSVPVQDASHKMVGGEVDDDVTAPNTPLSTSAGGSKVLPRYPARHQPSAERPLSSDARFPLTLAKAREDTPDAIRWEDVRLDVKELMLQGYSHGAAYQLVQEDRVLHDRFRADHLEAMLKTAIVFEQLDQTPWFRFVPADLLDAAYAYATTPNFKAAYSWPPIPPAEEESADSDSSESAGDRLDPSFKSKAKSQRPLAAETRGRKRPAADTLYSDSSSSGPSPKKGKKTLILDDVDLSDAELRAAPVSSATSPWFHLGVRVAVSSARASKSLSGFPMYAHLRRPESVATLDARWDTKAYRDLLSTRPWETVWKKRIRHFFLYHEAVFSADQKAVLGRVIRFMHDYAQEIWERLHWVHIPAEDSEHGELTELGRRIHQSRKSRAAAMRLARVELIKEANEKLPTHIWYEPGLWAMPESGCEWILEHPKFKIPLGTQLQDLDTREPIRACWTSGSYDAVLQYVPPTLAKGCRTGQALECHLIPADPALATEPLKELAITGGYLKRG